jgi:hypothetical protein
MQLVSRPGALADLGCRRPSQLLDPSSCLAGVCLRVGELLQQVADEGG